MEQTTTEAENPVYVVFAPRGYKNELDVAVFGTQAEADTFKRGLVSPAYGAPANWADTKEAIKRYNETSYAAYHLTPLARYLSEHKGQIIDGGA